LKRGLTKHLAICDPSAENFITCTDCGKKFASHRSLENHLGKCTHELSIQRMQKTIVKHQQAQKKKPNIKIINTIKINKISNNYSTTNNTVNNNTVQLLTLDSDALESMRLRDFYDMQNLADFHLKHTVKGCIIKTDAARGTIMYKLNEDDEPVKDAKAVQLASSLCEVSREKALQFDQEARQHLLEDNGDIVSQVYSDTRKICQGVASKSAKAVELLGKAIVKQVPSAPPQQTRFTKIEQKIKESVGPFLETLFQSDKFKMEGGRLYITSDDGKIFQDNQLIAEKICENIKLSLSL
jgi:hypothetical protein